MTCACKGKAPKGEAVPEAYGRIVWLGVEWEGLPAPVRFAAWAWRAWRHGADESPQDFYRRFPGCGCVARLKAAWSRRTRHERTA